MGVINQSPPANTGPTAAHQIAAEALRQRRAARADLESYRSYLEKTFPREFLPPARHHALMQDIGTQIARGELRRVAVSMPPAHAKSLIFSIRLPTFLLASNPELRILCISNTFTLAEQQARVRRNILLSREWQTLAQTEIAAASDNQVAALDIGTTAGGYVRTFSAGATVIGQRADVVIVDDIIVSLEEALNPDRLRSLRDWYFSEVRSRFELTSPPVEVLVGTRWSRGDLFGAVDEAVAAGREEWKVIRLPLLCNSALDPLGRAQGAYLWPELPDLDRRVLEWQRTLGPTLFSAMYQQLPLDDVSNWCSADMLEIVDAAPNELRMIGGTDLALGSESSARGDYSVHVVGGTAADGCLYILDLWRSNTSPVLDTIDAMLDLVALHGYQVQLTDDDNIVKALRTNILRRMTERGIHFQLVQLPMRGKDKVARAASLQMLLHARRVKLVREPWNRELVDELVAFGPGATGHDDMVDALGLIAREIAKVGQPTVKPNPITPRVGHRAIGAANGHYAATLNDLFEDYENALPARSRIP